MKSSNSLPNVKEHAPLSAGADTDHQQNPAPTEPHEHGGADRGCVARLVRCSSLATDEQALKAYRWLESMFMRGEPLSIQTLYEDGEAEIQIHVAGFGALRFLPRKNLADEVVYYCDCVNLPIDSFTGISEAPIQGETSLDSLDQRGANSSGVNDRVQTGSETPSIL